MKRSHWFEILLIVVVLAIQLYAAFSEAHNFPNNWFIRDDAYYYFKVAENIGLGHGSTFDGINPTNGYHPLWMLVCIPIFALARFDLNPAFAPFADRDEFVQHRDCNFALPFNQQYFISSGRDADCCLLGFQFLYTGYFL